MKKSDPSLRYWFAALFLSILFLPLIASADTFSSAHSSLSEAEMEILSDGEISPPKRVMGGVLGSLVGFGTGHLAVGKYQEMGWIFTIGELASVYTIALSTSETSTNYFTGRTANTGLLWIGAAGFVGLKIWEIVDVWVRPNRHNQIYESIRSRAGPGTPSRIGSEFSIAPIITSEGSLAMGLGVIF